MAQIDWLVNSYNPCVARLTAVLCRRCLAPARDLDLAEESVQEAIEAVLRTGQVFENEDHCRNWIFPAAYNHAM